MNDRTTKPRPEVEILQRTRRIETRLTQTMIALGILSEGQKPVFDPGSTAGGEARMILPSIHCSMKEIVDSVPAGWHGTFGVFVGTDKVATIDRQGC